MLFALHRTVLRRRDYSSLLAQFQQVSAYHASRHQRVQDPRLKEFDSSVIKNEFAVIRDEYQAPKYPIILAHGLLGFDELHLDPTQLLPGIAYWRGIREALAAQNVEVITATVPPSGSIEKRAERLGERIAESAQGRAVNIIAYVHLIAGKNTRIGRGE